MARYRTALLDQFDSIPKLNKNGPVGRAKFVFPKLIRRDRSKVMTGKDLPDTTRASTTDIPEPRGAVERIKWSLDKATRKLRYLDQSIETWRESLVFAGDRYHRLSREKRYAFHPSKNHAWEDEVPINESREIANDWFLNHFLTRVSSGGEHSHTSAVIGEPGCGKSTLLKYLILENFNRIQARKIVLSRFEFSKFKTVKGNKGQFDKSLYRYLSFIHTRDLIISHLYAVRQGAELSRRLDLENDTAFCARIEELKRRCTYSEIINANGLNSAQIMAVEEAFRAGDCGNQELTKAVRALTFKLRMVIISVLCADRKLVTILDGLDSVRIEDAFIRTKDFIDVRRLIESRSHMGEYPTLSDHGIIIPHDSLVVMRSNTAALLHIQADPGYNDLSFSNYYRLEQIDPRTAMVKIAYRSISFVSEFTDTTDKQVNGYVFNLMRIMQRTMLAIGRGSGERIGFDSCYGIFDGNLRLLFSFMRQVMSWQLDEMLKKDLLSPGILLGSISPIVSEISSDTGNYLLEKKSYRIIELLMFRKAENFNNALSIQVVKDPLFSGQDEPLVKLKRNKAFTGRVDNIFNYLTAYDQSQPDKHSLLEKIRIIQLTNEEGMGILKLRSKLKNEFGYEVANLETTVSFLLKSNLLTATANLDGDEPEFILSASNRGNLCISSLIFNLSYIEHIFHCTLLPTPLISGIEDEPRRDETSREWAVNSIRNAFIFLSYVQFVEDNPAQGQRVPNKYRIADNMRKSIKRCIDRMTKSTIPEHVHSHDPPDETPNSVSAGIIAEDAFAKVSTIKSSWRKRKLF